MMFQGAGQHNYARECAEIPVIWKYELTEDLRRALERSWFVNRWGLEGHWIAADLYLEQLNLLVKVCTCNLLRERPTLTALKQIFIAKGNGVTIEYIMGKGSACVEALRQVSHSMARFFGDPDRRRVSKEVAFQEDMRVLVEELDKKNLGGNYQKRLVPVCGKGKKAAALRAKGTSAIIDVFVAGTDVWADSFLEWKKDTTYDPAVGYAEGTESADVSAVPLDNGTVFDDPSELHLSIDENIDLGILPDGEIDGLGGGDDIDLGEVD